MREPLARQRAGVVGLLVSLFVLTYLDRVCMSVAGPRMQVELHISPVGWGWVTGMFTLSYGLFEIPSGVLGDRIGPRKVLTRIVLWWSGFTALTGAVSSFSLLLVTRLLFGAGEAGAYPNASVVIARWFRPERRGTMMGVILMASQVGGAIAPLLVIPIQMRFGWRASFYTFGGLGLIWAGAWYWRFRDSPAEKMGGVRPSGERKAAESGDEGAGGGHGMSWRAAFRSRSVLSLLGASFCCVYVYNFFQTWLHTFLVKGRGFTETGLMLTALPFVVAGCANLGGGFLTDALVRRLGFRNGRRMVGAGGLAGAGVFTVAAMVTRRPDLTLVFLSLVYGGTALQQSASFGACLDIGERCAGAIVGLMNTAAQVGGLVGAVAYGYLVERFHNYNAPFIPMAAVLFVGSLLWLKVDASRSLSGEVRVVVGA